MSRVSGGPPHLAHTTYPTLSFPMFVSNFQEFVLSLRFAYLANRSGCFCSAGSAAASPAVGASATHSCPSGFSSAKLPGPAAASVSALLPSSRPRLASTLISQLQDVSVI